jgi:hypothetical protein
MEQKMEDRWNELIIKKTTEIQKTLSIARAMMIIRLGDTRAYNTGSTKLRGQISNRSSGNRRQTYQRKNAAACSLTLSSTVGCEVRSRRNGVWDCRMEISMIEDQIHETHIILAEHPRSARPRTSVPQHWGVSRGPQRLEAV